MGSGKHGTAPFCQWEAIGGCGAGRLGRLLGRRDRAAQDLDPYAYAADDPATQSDPTGLCPTGPMGEPLNCNGTPVGSGTPAGSGSGDTGTAGSTGGGGGCGFLGLDCAWHATADVLGGAVTGTTRVFAGPIAEMEAGMVNAFPTGVTATGGLEYGNDVSASSMTTWHVGDPGSPLYKAAYYAAYYAAPLALGAGADADVIAAEDGNGLSAAACGGGQSFTPGTKVLLASGAAVPIADLKPGGKVLATNTKTGKTSAETIAAVLVHHDTDLYDLTVKSHGQTQVIHTTANHIFWDPDLKQWRAAAKLKKGEHLKTANGTTVVSDGGTTPKRHDGRMWDLTVPGNNDHDFYVVAGGTAVLVHNCGGQIPYNSDELSSAAYQARVAAGVGPGRNVAAAGVEGLDDPVIGFSKGDGYHSENDILDQLTARGIDPSQITELYSERQPCSSCSSMLGDALAPGTPITYSVPWGDDPFINSASNELLRQMIGAQ